MDEELIRAIDRVLSLSGGDLVKGEQFPCLTLSSQTETSQATAALNER